MSIAVEQNGIAKIAKNVFVEQNGVAKKVKAAWIEVDGFAKKLVGIGGEFKFFLLVSDYNQPGYLMELDLMTYEVIETGPTFTTYREDNAFYAGGTNKNIYAAQAIVDPNTLGEVGRSSLRTISGGFRNHLLKASVSNYYATISFIDLTTGIVVKTITTSVRPTSSSSSVNVTMADGNQDLIYVLYGRENGSFHEFQSIDPITGVVIKKKTYSYVGGVTTTGSQIAVTDKYVRIHLPKTTISFMQVYDINTFILIENKNLLDIPGLNSNLQIALLTTKP